MRGSVNKVEAKIVAQQKRIGQRKVERVVQNMEKIRMEKELEMEKKK
jgi:hypothetical protein